MSLYSRLIFTVNLPEGGGGVLMVNLMLTLNCQSLLELIWARRDIDAARFPPKRAHRYEAALLNPSCGAFADCRRFTGNFHLPSSRPRDVDFYGLHGRLPSALYFIPL